MTDIAKLAYFAGILDGEGYLSIGLHKPARRHTALVGVINTDKRLIDWLRENFGGSLYLRKSPSFKPHWKDRYDWRIIGPDIDLVLPEVLQFLVIKRQQAEAILELRSTMDLFPRHIRLSEEMFQKRELIRLAVVSLNYRAVPV